MLTYRKGFCGDRSWSEAGLRGDRQDRLEMRASRGWVSELLWPGVSRPCHRLAGSGRASEWVKGKPPRAAGRLRDRGAAGGSSEQGAPCLRLGLL